MMIKKTFENPKKAKCSFSFMRNKPAETCIYLEDFEEHGFEIVEDYRGRKFACKDEIILNLYESLDKKSINEIHVCIGKKVELDVKLEETDCYENFVDKMVEALKKEVENTERTLEDEKNALKWAEGVQQDTYEEN